MVLKTTKELVNERALNHYFFHKLANFLQKF